MQARMGTLMRRRMGASIGTSLRCSIRAVVCASAYTSLLPPCTIIQQHEAGDNSVNAPIRVDGGETL